MTTANATTEPTGNTVLKFKNFAKAIRQENLAMMTGALVGDFGLLCDTIRIMLAEEKSNIRIANSMDVAVVTVYRTDKHEEFMLGILDMNTNRLSFAPLPREAASSEVTVLKRVISQYSKETFEVGRDSRD